MLSYRRVVLCTAKSIDNYVCPLADPLIELHRNEEPQYVTVTSNQFVPRTLIASIYGIRSAANETLPFISSVAYSTPITSMALYHGHSTSRMQSPEQHCALNSIWECLSVVEDVFKSEYEDSRSKLYGVLFISNCKRPRNSDSHVAAVKESSLPSFQEIISHCPFTQSRCHSHTRVTDRPDTDRHSLSLTEIDSFTSYISTFDHVRPLCPPCATEITAQQMFTPLSCRTRVPSFVHSCSNCYISLHLQAVSNPYQTECRVLDLNYNAHFTLLCIDERHFWRESTVDRSIEKEQCHSWLASTNVLKGHLSRTITHKTQIHRKPNTARHTLNAPLTKERCVQGVLKCLQRKPPLVRASLSKKSRVNEPYLSQLGYFESAVMLPEFLSAQIRTNVTKLANKSLGACGTTSRFSPNTLHRRHLSEHVVTIRRLSWNLGERSVKPSTAGRKEYDQSLSIFDFVKLRCSIDGPPIDNIREEISPKKCSKKYPAVMSGLSHCNSRRNVCSMREANDNRYPGGDVPQCAVYERPRMCKSYEKTLKHRRQPVTADRATDPKWRIEHAVIQNQYSLAREDRRPQC